MRASRVRCQRIPNKFSETPYSWASWIRCSWSAARSPLSIAPYILRLRPTASAAACWVNPTWCRKLARTSRSSLTGTRSATPMPSISAAAARFLGEGATLPVSHALMVAALTPERRESSLRLSCRRLRCRRNAAGLKPCTPLRAMHTSVSDCSCWPSPAIPAAPRRLSPRCSAKNVREL